MHAAVWSVLPIVLDLVTEVKRKVSWWRPRPQLGCRAKAKKKKKKIRKFRIIIVHSHQIMFTVGGLSYAISL
jgi:hypothetical protein